MKTISLKLPDDLLTVSTRVAEALGLSRTEYIRRALHDANRRVEAARRAERLGEVSRRVRAESARVNAEFARVDEDPDA